MNELDGAIVDGWGEKELACDEAGLCEGVCDGGIVVDASGGAGKCYCGVCDDGESGFEGYSNEGVGAIWDDNDGFVGVCVDNCGWICGDVD